MRLGGWPDGWAAGALTHPRPGAGGARAAARLRSSWSGVLPVAPHDRLRRVGVHRTSEDCLLLWFTRIKTSKFTGKSHEGKSPQTARGWLL